MKKLFLLAILTFSVQLGYGQMTSEGGKGLSCVEQGINYLASCLTDNDVDFNIINDGMGIAFVTSSNNPPPGQVKSCIAKYNKFVRDCEEAPEVIYDDSDNGNQLEGTPQ